VLTNTVLNNAYKKEKDSNVKERILLVRRVKIDKQEASSVAENELKRSRWWAYKWLHRFDKDGLDGLKDQPRTGRPPDVSKDVMMKIKQELADSNTGWDFRQVMDLIYMKTGVIYHEVHVYRLLHKWEIKSKVPQKRFVNTASKKDKRKFKKRVKQILSRLKTGWNVIVQDESIFVYDYLIRRKKWVAADKRPILTVTGSRKRTIAFGSLSYL
jgi:putative transposase